MKAFLDSSVLVATFYGDHEHHEPSIELFLRYEKAEACCGAHSLAEVYASLTGMPGKHRASVDETMLFLGNVRERLQVITLSDGEYFKAVEAAAGERVVSGGVYDALLAQCALKAGAEAIYTWNVKHFQRLGPAIAVRVTTP
ncbi:MAG: PIN domain-containing protein [Acidobacteria bacterium]|nr:PIN domain-containing protein [Acidobacteriota bacterium]